MATVINTIKIVNSIADEPIVPKFRPPFSKGFVSKSPKVAPNGRVKTNANQNVSLLELVATYGKLFFHNCPREVMKSK